MSPVAGRVMTAAARREGLDFRANLVSDAVHSDQRRVER
jgi:hypothetical protein